LSRLAQSMGARVLTLTVGAVNGLGVRLTAR
jgi:hypothetical protein